ncbi:hypothetical protein [Spirosoma koreense]
MKLLGFSTLILLVSVAYGQQLPKRNVLFIGNSLTYYGGMPDYLKAMLERTHPEVNLTVSAFPGMSLEAHLTQIIVARNGDGTTTRIKKAGEQTETEKAIVSQPWDIVILQEAPFRILIPEVRKYSSQVSIEKIKKLVTNSKCQFILFKTWAPKREFPTQFCYPAALIDRPVEKEQYCSRQVNSLEDEFKLLSSESDSLAAVTKVNTIDIGQTYHQALTEHRLLGLYDQDGHPTKLGAYLNAYIFYRFLVGTEPVRMDYYGDLSKEEATALQGLAQ